MTPLPAALGGSGLTAWRLERDKHLDTWDKAEGAFLVGGRWSSAGRRTLYTALDPATAILELAVHRGFNTLDAVPHSLFELNIDPANVHVVHPSSIANPLWLHPGAVSPNQQKFGDALLDQHPIVVVPSVVSRHSWNLLINLATAQGSFELKTREAFGLDTRLVASL